MNWKTKMIMAAVAAVSATSVGSAQAFDVFYGGSSAAREMINEIVLPTCNTSLPITHYQSPNSNLHLWQCTVKAGVGGAGNPVNIHYSARGSSDGVYPVNAAAGTPTSRGAYNGKGEMGYIDDSNPAANGCGALAAASRTFFDPTVGGNVTVNIQENKTCTNPPSAVTTTWPANLVRRSMQFGASDVQFPSFGQTSPAGTEPANPAPNVTGSASAVLPFAIVIQNNVRRLTAAGADAGPVQELTQLQIEQIFSRNVRDWRELGFNVTVNVDGTGGFAAAAPIRLCLREFGSGSKAAFDQVMMKVASETSSVNPNVFYSASSSGVRDCLNNNAGGLGNGLFNKVGYIDAREATASPSWVPPANAVANAIPNGHPVLINGYKSINEAGATRNATMAALRCGKAEFWVNLQFYRKNGGVTVVEGGAPATDIPLVNAYINSFITLAQNAQVIENLPASWAFEAPANMQVTKALDAAVPTYTPFAADPAGYNQCRGL
jgi:hypothetical protein